VFVLGPQEDQSFLLDVGNQTWTPVGGSSGVVNGGSIMYQPGKVLYAGGAASFSTSSNAQATSAVIDLTAQTPAWHTVGPMAYARAFNTMTMLADGTVLVVGGEPVTAQPNGQGEVSGGVLPSEIWNPATQQWTTVASMAVTRGYHTSALLLPDGRVLVAGSGHAGPGYPGQYSAQIYSPPYLFSGTRPTITSLPSSATYNSSITVSTPDATSIKAVNLVDLGASTHQVDFNQHFVPLSFTAGSGTLNVQVPASGAYAPPGKYMLFIVNSNGVPSVASFISLASSSGAAPSAPRATKATPVSATAARVTWKAPETAGRPIRSYTVTPYAGSRALNPTNVSGSPAPTATTIGGLMSGRTYTFKVRATDAIGTGPTSSPSNAVTPTAGPRPAFIQKTSAYADTTPRLALRLGAPVTTGDRLLVEASVWGRGATAASVSDSAGDQYTELLRRVAPDGTEMSVWTAPVTARDGTQPSIAVVPTLTSDVGAVGVEYSGLSRAPGASAVDQIAGAGGRTRGPATVRTSPTRTTTGDEELAVGLYADSGFGDALTAGRGFMQRVNISPTTTSMEQLVEDRVVGRGFRPDSTVHTGAQTPWMMATIVFKNRARAGTGNRGSGGLPDLSAPTGSTPPKGQLIPLSARHRPHPVAGAITGVAWRQSDGRLIHFYCLVDPSGLSTFRPISLGQAAGPSQPGRSKRSF
jgi:hypothetical protein